MSLLQHSKEEIFRFMSDNPHERVTMSGMVRDLQKLKAMIEDNYDRASYMTYDIGYHGWSGDAAQNMCSIEKEITKRMKEIYALCLMGLGENTTKDTFDNR